MSATSHAVRSGRCAIVGRPNVGKSTLLNALIGQKLAIATSKPQTTRSCLLGVYVRKDPPTQIAFVDTPGLHDPRNTLGRALVEQAKGAMHDTDIRLMVSDAPAFSRVRGVLNDDKSIIQALRDGPPVILALNKVDRQRDKGHLLPLIEAYAEYFPFVSVVPISAQRGSNLDALLGELRGQLPEAPYAYADDTLTDKPERFLCAELVREAVIEHTRAELPHAVATLVESFEEQDKCTHIAVQVVVEKESQKGIIIGAGGERLKSIGTAARLQMETLLGRKVFLQTWVKVIPGWTRDPVRIRELIGDATL